MALIKDSEFGSDEKIRYKTFSMRLHNGTIDLIKLAQKNSGKSWNKFIYNLLIQNNMGLLDPLPPFPGYIPPKNKPSVELNCERCGQKFMGYTWMLKSKKEIICPSCWKHQQFEEEDNL